MHLINTVFSNKQPIDVTAKTNRTSHQRKQSETCADSQQTSELADNNKTSHYLLAILEFISNYLECTYYDTYSEWISQMFRRSFKKKTY